MENPFEVTGSLGDTIGGFANLATLVVAFWAAKSAFPKELRKVRAEHHLSVKAQAAREIWIAAYDLMLAIEALRSAVAIGPPAPAGATPMEEFEFSRKQRLEDFARAANAFIKCWAVSELYFDDDVGQALRAVWKAKAQLQVDLSEFVRGLNGSDNLRNYEALFGAAAKQQLEELKAQTKTLFRPLALPSEVK